MVELIESIETLKVVERFRKTEQLVLVLLLAKFSIVQIEIQIGFNLKYIGSEETMNFLPYVLQIKLFLHCVIVSESFI